MESYIHLYSTNEEFTAAYNSPNYKEPWLSLTEENNAINYSKILTAITFNSITWVTDVPAKGGTATKDNCEFKVYANYDNGSFSDISSDVIVTGELAVESSTSDQRHEAGQLTLTASYGDFTATGNVTAYQEAVPDFSTEPLTFNILSDGTINWTADNSSIAKTIDYKVNNGEWTSIASNIGSLAPTIEVSSGDKLQFRGNNTQYATYDSWDYNSFSDSTASFEIEGNIMSLIYGDDFKNKLTISSTYAFASLFRDCTKLVSAENLILPATTLANNCYQSMFRGCTSLTRAPKELSATNLASNCYSFMFEGCTSLTTAPVLPATTLTNSCYYEMFYNCSKLTTAPELPATKLADKCYQNMFNGCTSLTTAPALPATTLKDYCYHSMFYGCTSLTTAPELPAITLTSWCYTNMFKRCTSLTTAPVLPATNLKINCYLNMFAGCASLTKAPELPATNLANNCYDSMFQDCTSLTTAPELPATTLSDACYQWMFKGCTSLNYIKCLATNISARNCTNGWVDGVASNGTFVKALSMTSWTTDYYSGIPKGWTVQDAS